MPTYQYVCTECGGQLEAVQKFTDEALSVHEDCGGRLRKVFSPVGIVFKGSGFYRTDSRGKEPSGASSSASSSKESGSKEIAGRSVNEKQYRMYEYFPRRNASNTRKPFLLPARRQELWNRIGFGMNVSRGSRAFS